MTEQKSLLHPTAIHAYRSLVMGQDYLILLITETISLVFSVISQGISGLLSQVLPMLILVGLYLARKENATGVSMVRICVTIQYWISLIGGGLAVLIVLIFGIRLAQGNIQNLFAVLLVVLILGAWTGMGVLFYWSIRTILLDIQQWFDGPMGEERCRTHLRMVCIVRIALQGVIALGILITIIVAGSGSVLLDMIADMERIGENMSGLLRLFIPATNAMGLLAVILAIVKLIFIMRLNAAYGQLVPMPDEAERERATTTHKNVHLSGQQRQEPVIKVILIQTQPTGGQRSSCRMGEHDTIVIGRRPDMADLVLTGDGAIAGRNCKLYVYNHHLYLEDMNSTNGTWLNGKRLTQPQQVSRGDEIRLGRSTFVLNWEK